MPGKPGRPRTNKPAQENQVTQRRKVGRKRLGDAPVEAEGTAAVEPKKKIRRPSGFGRLSKGIERLGNDLIQVYLKTGGKESLIEAVEKDPAMKRQFHKELSGILRKLFDLEVAKMKMESAKQEGANQGGHSGPQNVFIIHGLHDLPEKVNKAIEGAINGEVVKEAQFTVVGLGNK